jgi:hypothetical protein
VVERGLDQASKPGVNNYGDAAFEYVMHYDEPSTFPFSLVSARMQ